MDESEIDPAHPPVHTEASGAPSDLPDPSGLPQPVSADDTRYRLPRKAIAAFLAGGSLLALPTGCSLSKLLPGVNAVDTRPMGGSVLASDIIWQPPPETLRPRRLPPPDTAHLTPTGGYVPRSNIQWGPYDSTTVPEDYSSPPANPTDAPQPDVPLGVEHTPMAGRVDSSRLRWEQE